MADVQEIIVKYVNEVDEAVAELNKYAKAQDQVIDGEKEQAQSAKKADVTLKQASEQRLANLKKEEAELKRLVIARKKAFTVEDISRYNKQIAETQNRISVLKNETSSFGKTATNIFAGIGAGIAAGFTVQAIQQFASQSIDAFLEAEANAERLRFAITTIGGESEVQFERLIKQSAELQNITVFSDDSIQQAQAALSAFGLTADQIEALIPKLADFATITGQDIPSAAAQIGGALEGNGREFKKYGIEVDAASTRTENLNAVMAGLVQFSGSAENATKTLTGQLKQQENAVDDLQEAIGERLAPVWVRLKQLTFEVLDNITKSFNIADQEAAKTTLNGRELLKNLAAEDIARRQKIQGITQEAAEQQILVEIGKDLQENRRLEIENSIKENRIRLNELALAKEQLQTRAGVINELIRERAEAEKSAKKLKEKEEAERLANQKAKQNSDTRIAGSAKEVEQIERLTAAYKDLLNLESLSDSDKQILELSFNTGDIESFKKKVAEVVANNPIEIPVELTIPEGRENTEMVNLADQTEGIQLQMLQDWLKTNDEMLKSSLQLFTELTDLYDTFANNRIDQITKEKDAEIQAIDAKIEANKTALENRDISVKTEKELNDKLEADKVAAQKKADKEIRKIKRAQAILDKSAALFQIALNTAIALSNPANLAPIPGALTPFILALAGVQSAAVIASAIPAFEKGTKGKKGSGFALVGEKGAELTYLDDKTKVVPAHKTRSNARIVDAMIDGRLDSYINKNYVMPALLGQKKAFEAYKQAEVIKAQNEQTIITNYGTRQKFPDGFMINNTDQLARAIANEIRTDPYRR